MELTADQRSSVANHYGAQAFISIHVGASQSREKSGPVVYTHRYLSETGPFDADPDRAGQLPPRPLLGRGFELIDPESRMVPWTNGQMSHLNDSRRLAQRLQRDLNSLWGTHNQNWALPLAVLAPVAAPAMMVEIGYLTNTSDVQKLQSEDFREQLASTIASTVLVFLESRSAEGQVLN